MSKKVCAGNLGIPFEGIPGKYNTITDVDEETGFIFEVALYFLCFLIA
jgi:hypothetical protein